MFYAVLYSEVVHSHKHTLMSSDYSSLDWVLCHWAHFTVRRFMFICVFCVFCQLHMLYYCDTVG